MENDNEKVMALLDYLEENGFDPIGASDLRSEMVQLGRALKWKMSPEEILEEWKANERLKDMLDSPAFKQGADLGHATGALEAYEQAQAAYDHGEIELWLRWQKPKSIEGWREFEAEYGDSDAMRARWGLPPKRTTE